MKNILITGVLGHLGSKFAKLLLDNFPMYNIVGIDNEADSKYIDNKEIFNNYNNFDYIKGDIGNSRLLANILTEKKTALTNLNSEKGIDFIFNFAFNSMVLNKDNLAIAYIKDNFAGALNIAIEAIKHWGKDFSDKRLVYISSMDVYRFTDAENCYTEEDFPNTQSIGGNIKLSVESLLKSLNENFGLPVTIIRTPFLVGQSKGIYPILPDIFYKLKYENQVRIDLNPETVINIGYIEDMLIAIESTIKDKLPFCVYNAAGHNVSIKKIVDTFCSFVKTNKPEVIYGNEKKLHLCVKGDKIYNSLQWKHYTDFETFMEKVADEI